MKKFVQLFLFAFVWSFKAASTSQDEIERKNITLSTTQIVFLQTLRSLETQWKDLTLVDDVTGIGKLVGQLRPYKDYVRPYFYKVSKGIKAFDILGTIHTLPLCLLPPFIESKLLEASVLINEGRETGDGLSNCYQSSFNWFELLADRQQKHLHHLPNLEIPDPIKLDVRVAWACYEQLHFQGMDREIISRFEKGQKPVIDLESLYDFEEILLPSENDILSLFQEVLEESVIYGGHLHTPDKINSGYQYLMGLLTFTDGVRPVLDQENKKWFSQLKNILERTQTSVGVVVGLAHVIDYYKGSKGLLSYFLEDGWGVQRYDREGNLSLS